MPEGVVEPSATGAEDLLDDVSIDRRAGIAGLLDCGIDIIDVHDQTDRRA